MVRNRPDQIFRVYENFMWYPPHRLARSLIDAGEIGNVISIQLLTAARRMTGGQGWEIPMFSQAWRLKPELAGGGMVTFDHGFHCFQLARYFVDEEVDSVHAFINFVRLPGLGEVDAPAVVPWRYGAGNRVGSWTVVPSLDLEVRSKYYVEDDRLEIRGTSGIIWVTRCTGRLLEEPPVVLYRDGVTRSFHNVETDWASSFRDCTFDFIEAVAEGRPCALDVDDARKTLAFAIAAQLSAREGREVTIAEVSSKTTE